MASPTTRPATTADFDRFITLPENMERNFELIGGAISEVVSNNYCSQIASKLNYHIERHLIDHDLGGNVTAADCGYIVSGEWYMPDVGFISKARQPKPSHATYNPLAPDFAVEVLSPTDSPKKLMEKVANYLAAGTVVLVVYPDDKEAAVYTPGKAVQKMDVDDTFDGGDVLPGFTLHVKDMFPNED